MSKARRKPNARLHKRPLRKDAGSGRLKPINKRHVVPVCLALVVLTLAAYSQVGKCDFVVYDDDDCVTANPHIQGLTWQNVGWAFNIGYASNWHPLTWISHMLDYRLFGAKPMGHHLINLVFHVGNTILLLLILTRMTGSLWRSGFVAALFAVHPLHVESVAWVAERKDVLSAFFWMLTMGAYVLYSEKPSIKRYLPVVFLYALGLMAKPMLVTLPFVLLLLDYWPLKRGKPWSGLVLEKTPLLAMSAASCVITFVAQASQDSVGGLDQLGMPSRIANALVGYALYLWKMLWPRNLAVLYPHPGNILPIWQTAASAALLISISALVLTLRRNKPYLTFGWLWFLGTLVPVIGVIQVGSQAMADRYTYIPLIGIFVIAAWGIADTMRRGDRATGRRGEEAPFMLAVLACLVIVSLAVGTWVQVRYWRKSITLFEHTLACTSRNYVIENMLGAELAKEGRLSEAIEHHEAALRIDPGYAPAHNNLGSIMQSQGKLDQAAAHYEAALKDCPDSIMAHTNYGVLLATQGKVDEAVSHLIRALELDPDEPRAHFNLGMIFQNTGKTEEAISEYRKCLHSNPNHANAHYYLGRALETEGKLDEAAREYQNALDVDASFGQAAMALQRLQGH